MPDQGPDQLPRKLRSGYTTGSCAAAAAKAAVILLYQGQKVSAVQIETLDRQQLSLAVNHVRHMPGEVICSVKKDAGDDPDITNGIDIYVQARPAGAGVIDICGGTGVGKVTKKGLAVPVGEAAINPGPRLMIERELQKVLPLEKGVKLEIFVPGGEKIAAKTLNPRLGITGGISILGTTGIVKPMSEEAYCQSLALNLSILKESGCTMAVFVPGNYGKRFCLNRLKLAEEVVITTANFIGFMLDQALYYGIKKILFAGHAGKLVKVAGGIFNTHSKLADARLEILAAHFIQYCNDIKTARRILEDNTVEEAFTRLHDQKLRNQMANKICAKCCQRTGNRIQIETILFNYELKPVAFSDQAWQLVKELRHVS